MASTAAVEAVAPVQAAHAVQADQANDAGVLSQHAQVEGAEQQMAGMNLGTAEEGAAYEGELHRACAAGNLDEVRSVLSRGLEALEVPDNASGCTPIVLAIRYNHHEVVKELLSAGAMIPPPGLTSDPHMNALLYPQSMYGMQPYMPMGPPEFYAHQQQQPGGYYPDGQRMSFSGTRKDGGVAPPAEYGANGSTLPPLDVAKTIPCRNFPMCKYGNNCAFFHPRLQPYYPGSPAGFVPNGAPAGYEQGYPPYMGGGPGVPGPYFQPGQPMYNPSFQPQQQPALGPSSSSSPQPVPEQGSSAQPSPAEGSTEPSTESPAGEQQAGSAPADALAPQPMSAFIPPFHPAGMPMSPTPPPPFGISPMSPNPNGLAGGPLPTLPPPPPEAFYATSPPSGGMLGPAGVPAFVPGAGRRQSFNSAAAAARGGHAKKPSFSGGARPWPSSRASIGGPNGTGSPGLGSWKDGVPPPCAFFAQAKCRNGEFCKFPHIDQDGNDCRHPDVVRGVMAPLPSLSRQHRNMRLSNGFAPFNPAFQQQQHLAFMRGANQANGEHEASGAADAAPAAVEEEAVEVTPESSPAAAAVAEETAEKPAAAQTAASENVAPAAVTPAPAPAKTNNAATASSSNVGRSASQPGIQRVQANGHGSRSHSPGSANGSFHGHPGQNARRAHSRPGGGGFHHANGGGHGHHGAANGTAGAGAHRSVSAGAEKTRQAQNQQRLPRADEFPALGGAAAANGENKPAAAREVARPSGITPGKTAAQVLAEPAPPKPVKPVPAPAAAATEDAKSESGVSVSMESEAGTDAVVISLKSSTAPTTNIPTPAGGASPVKPSVSFASIAGSAPASAPAAAAVEPAPVAVKAA